jgi:putative tryptophan/tyrosine transport system substrate-binding protein
VGSVAARHANVRQRSRLITNADRTAKRRRQFLVTAGALLVTPIASFAQQRSKLVRIGILVVPSAADYAARTDALRAGLRDLGYVEGRDTLLEFRSAEGKFDRLPELAADLVRQNVDVIVVAGTPAIRAAKQATETIPIVIAAVGDAVAGGLVSNLSRPGGNVTGSTYFARELATKQLELLKEAFPQVTRVAVIFNPGNPAMGPTLQAVESSARSLDLELERFAVREPPDFEGAFVAIARNRYRTALIIDDPITISNARALAELAVKHRLATGANFIEYAEAGGLMAYGVNLNAMWRRAALFVDRILKGASPGEIAVERSTRFDLVVNRKTATMLEVNIAPSILLRADRVIE